MEIPPGQKQFECEHCQAAILAPADLPATSAPCPMCHQMTTSPALDERPSRTNEGQGGNSAGRSQQPAPTPADQQNSSGGTVLLWGLAILTFVGLLTGGYYLYQEKRVKSEARGIALPDGPATLSVSRPVFDGVEKEALKILRDFLAAKTVEAKAGFVIGKEKSIPDMKNYYGGGAIEKDDLRADYFSEWAMDTVDTDRGIYLLEYDRPKQFKMGELFSPITDFKTHLTLKEPDLQAKAMARRGNFEMEAERARIFIKEVDGELLLDWHTYVQTKDRLFRDFIDYPVAGRKQMFRLVIGEDVGTIFEKDPSLRRYRLLDPAHSEEDVVMVTIEKNSEVGQILEKIAWTDVIGKNPNGSSITLELKWSNDSKPVMQISKVICWEFLGVGGDPSNLSNTK